jgi:membrane-bound lytic murein transglycosylase A
MASEARGTPAKLDAKVAAHTACAFSGVGTRAPHACAVVMIIAALTQIATGCGSTPPAPKAAQTGPSPVTETPLPVPAEQARNGRAADAGPEPAILNPMPASPAAALGETDAAHAAATPFATRNALYTPVSFANLPGWKTDDVAQSWEAFRLSCSVLGRKPGWSAPCTAMRNVNGNDNNAVRRFFEENFTVYQIRNVDKSARGVLTGYYEPILRGSRKYGAPYVYPVYGVPRDMLFLDARRLPPNARSDPIMARIEGHTVVPVASVSPGSARGVYALELYNSVPDIRDKRIRLRLEGNLIVPYYSRAQIERQRIDAPVLAYVADPAMLYSMQLQGAGKIVLPDGVSVIRLAYAEQNGFAFNPPVATASTKGRKVLVRGVEIDLEEGNVSTQNPAASADSSSSEDGPQSALLRGADASNASDGPSAARDSAGADGPPESPLLRGFNLTKAATPVVRPARANTAPSSVANVTTPGTPSTPAVHTAAAKAAPSVPPLSGASPLASSFASSDPSYVFFRTIPDSSAGPIGALGVPLSPERSAAVDPRTTPLGAPVFIDTSETATRNTGITRLLIAQDAGGAIRGAVRADYFFGTGETAQQKASTMKQPAQMWVLLPKSLRISAKESAVRVRGGPALLQADCVVDDPDLCVEDKP